MHISIGRLWKATSTWQVHMDSAKSDVLDFIFARILTSLTYTDFFLSIIRNRLTAKFLLIVSSIAVNHLLILKNRNTSLSMISSSPLNYIEFHWITLNYTELYWITLNYTRLQPITRRRWTVAKRSKSQVLPVASTILNNMSISIKRYIIHWDMWWRFCIYLH